MWYGLFLGNGADAFLPSTEIQQSFMWLLSKLERQSTWLCFQCQNQLQMRMK